MHALINRLRLHAEGLHSAHGHNEIATDLSDAADRLEILHQGMQDIAHHSATKLVMKERARKFLFGASNGKHMNDPQT